MANYLINRLFGYDDFIRSYKIEKQVIDVYEQRKVWLENEVVD